VAENKWLINRKQKWPAAKAWQNANMQQKQATMAATGGVWRADAWQAQKIKAYRLAGAGEARIAWQRQQRWRW
jgi:hypothetical protein